MDKSVPEQRSSTPQEIKIDWLILSALGSIIKWLAIFSPLTDAEWEQAGIHIQRVDGE